MSPTARTRPSSRGTASRGRQLPLAVLPAVLPILRGARPPRCADYQAGWPSGGRIQPAHLGPLGRAAPRLTVRPARQRGRDRRASAGDARATGTEAAKGMADVQELAPLAMRGAQG